MYCRFVALLRATLADLKTIRDGKAKKTRYLLLSIPAYHGTGGRAVFSSHVVLVVALWLEYLGRHERKNTLLIKKLWDALARNRAAAAAMFFSAQSRGLQEGHQQLLLNKYE